MIGVVDYGAGNLLSVGNALDALGLPFRMVRGPRDLPGLDRVLLPGVGHFGAMMAALGVEGLRGALLDHVEAGGALFGICLGFQALYEGSEEAPGVRGLGLLPGQVRRLRGVPKVPHMGWNDVTGGACVYFAHSFAAPLGVETSEMCVYGPPFAAAAFKGRVGGVQFHPEKSGEVGLRWLQSALSEPPRTSPVCGGGDEPSESGGGPWGSGGEGAGGEGLQSSGPMTSRGPLTPNPLSPRGARGPGVPVPGSRSPCPRIIPCLDVSAGRVVKGVNFVGLRDAGDPVELAQRYYEQGADEIVFLDITASSDRRDTIVETVEAVAKRVFVPLCVGGGVRSVEDARRLLSAGADKVAVNTAALANPALITALADAYGSQAVVLAVDAKQIRSPIPASRFPVPDSRHWNAFSHGGRTDTGRDVLEWVREGVRRGAGELLLTSMDADGVRAGFDLALTRAVSLAVSVPVIASGGAGSPADFVKVFGEGRADAALAASIFHDGEYTVGSLKVELAKAGVAVR